MPQKKRRRGITEVIRDVLEGSPMLPNIARARETQPKRPSLSRTAPPWPSGSAESIEAMRAHERKRKPEDESLSSFLRRRRRRG